MLRNHRYGMLVIGLLGMLIGTAAMAQYAIPATVFSGGASIMSGTSYGIKGSVGQGLIGVSSSASYADSAGFWYVTGRATPAAAGDLPPTLPQSFSLEQNYPNPFNPTTEIRFVVPNSARVTIKVFNVAGQLVETLANGQFSAGEHSVNWNADRHASGIYLIRMSAPGFSQIRRAVLLK